MDNPILIKHKQERNVNESSPNKNLKVLALYSCFEMKGVEKFNDPIDLFKVSRLEDSYHCKRLPKILQGTESEFQREISQISGKMLNVAIVVVVYARKFPLIKESDHLLLLANVIWKYKELQESCEKLCESSNTEIPSGSANDIVNCICAQIVYGIGGLVLSSPPRLRSLKKNKGLFKKKKNINKQRKEIPFSIDIKPDMFINEAKAEIVKQLGEKGNFNDSMYKMYIKKIASGLDGLSFDTKTTSEEQLEIVTLNVHGVRNIIIRLAKEHGLYIEHVWKLKET